MSVSSRKFDKSGGGASGGGDGPDDDLWDAPSPPVARPALPRNAPPEVPRGPTPNPRPYVRKETLPQGTQVVSQPPPPAPAITARPVVSIGGPPQPVPNRPPAQSKVRPPAPTGWANPDTTLAAKVASETNQFGEAPRTMRGHAEEAPRTHGSRPEVPAVSKAPISQGLSAEIDSAFDDMLGSEGAIEAAEVEDLGDMRELFAQIAAGYMRPVRDFVIELQWTEPSRDWLTICTPAVTSLRKSAEPINFQGLCDGLDVFLAALAAADSSREPLVGGKWKSAILAAYSKLVELLPQAFALGEERDRREAIIVHSLLKQISDVGKVTLDKLFAAGLGALDMMLLARPSDIVEATGIDRALAEKIVNRFAAYKREVEASGHDESRSAERHKLQMLVNHLKEENLAYDMLDADGSSEAAKKKKALRQSRAARFSEIQVVLARLGEVDLVQSIEPLPFARRLEELEKFLADEKQ